MKKFHVAPSTKTGSHHFIMQRLSALALIPLIIWLAYSFVLVISDIDATMAVFFAYPFNAVMGILLICAALYHGSLGMQVIFEDYISCKMKRRIMVIAIHFLSITTSVAAILAILRLNLIG